MGTQLGTVAQERQSYLVDLMPQVAEQWHTEFERFVETGEAEAAFLDYLNEDKGAQQAVETAFNRQAAKFEGLAAELKKSQTRNQSTESNLAASARVAAAVETALQTPAAQREKVMETSTAEIAASTVGEERIVLKEFARSLENNLTKVADVTHS